MLRFYKHEKFRFQLRRFKLYMAMLSMGKVGRRLKPLFMLGVFVCCVQYSTIISSFHWSFYRDSLVPTPA